MEEFLDITVKEYVRGLSEAWGLEDWFAWPPDMFALTSSLLTQTGAYIFTVLPPLNEFWPEEKDWKNNLIEQKTFWYDWITGELSDQPEKLQTLQLAIYDTWETVTLEHIHALLNLIGLQDSETRSFPKYTDLPRNFDFENTWKLCKAVLTLHSLSDETCAGFGTPSANNWVTKPEHKAVQCMANMLLAHTGTLSRLPLYVARVLPKLRTPNVGMTLRSLSHHLTVHQTEVDIRWRSMPWVNIDENTLNILIVPWPYKIEPSSFRPSSHATQRNSSEATRYFHYTGVEKEFKPKDLLDMIKEAERSVSRVHVIVFPEQSITKKNLNTLLDVLANNQSRDRMPMVVAGVRSDHEADFGGLSENSVILSTFFAGKWYQMEQYKHHRWKLDASQIKQYNLGGVLTSTKDWWEGIKLSSRRLSVLAPNNWMALCPLICEDLARLDPVSDLIRGIGPTLLIALLLDGPQVKPRWPGRYASIMADDPGSSVLTVSALGLTERAKRVISSEKEDTSRVVALWKDSIGGYQEISAPKALDDESAAVVLTVTATWREEFTADGRGDGTSAAVFEFQGTHPIVIKSSNDNVNNDDALKPVHSEQYDFLEISLFSYLTDTILSAPSDIIDALRALILGEAVDGVLGSVKVLSDLLSRVESSIQTVLGKENRESFRPFVHWICDFMKYIQEEDEVIKVNSNESIKYYRRVVNLVSQILTQIMSSNFLEDWAQNKPYQNFPSDILFLDAIRPNLEYAEKPREVRILIYGSLALLWAIHDRLASMRRQHNLNNEGTSLLLTIERLLAKKYDDQWIKAIHHFTNLQN